MPRYRQRFSDLEQQLRDNGNVATPGTRLGNYADFKAGKRKAERRKVSTADEILAKRNRLGLSLAPFNLPFATAQAGRYIASITQWSNDSRNGLTLGDPELGYARQVEGGITALGEDAFYPALIKPSIPIAGTAPSTPKSGITGTEYNYRATNSYSIPFGRVAADSSEQQRRVFLTTRAKGVPGAGKPKTVGYDPEVFRGIKTPLGEALAPAAAGT